MLLLLLHKQIGHIAKDWRGAILASQVSFLKRNSAADFVFGQGEQFRMHYSNIGSLSLQFPSSNR